MSADMWAHTVADLGGHNRLNSNQAETLQAGCHMCGSDSTSGLWQREWHREKEQRVCVRDRPKEREGGGEILSQDKEKEGKSWTLTKGKGHRMKGRRAKKRVG